MKKNYNKNRKSYIMSKMLFVIVGMMLFGLLLNACSNEWQPSVIELNDNWYLQTSDRVTEDGDAVSLNDFKTDGWYKISVPNTVLAGLVEAGIYKDIFKDRKLEEIDAKQFEKSWWYRNSFPIDNLQKHHLVLEGINYRAKIWVNGELVADSSDVEGAFGIWRFNISNKLAKGTNTLAIQIFPPKYNDLTIGFVDWNPAPPDKNMGIWRPVKIENTGLVNIDEPFVETKLNKETLKEAELHISTELTNLSDKKQSVLLKGEIGEISFEKQVEVGANQTLKVEFSPNEFDQLKIENPKLWWPNLMGEQNLHQLKLSAEINGILSDVENTRFGVRTVEDYWNEEGHKGYKVNGREVLIKGAGWVDDILLADTDDKVTAQMEYVKHMNMNCVRLEGFWGRNKTLYDKADELGLLLMIGWSCHWEWTGYCGRPQTDYMCITSDKDMDVQSKAFQDQVKWLRNHPSIYTWVYGSDKLPLPKLERLLNERIGAVDTTRPILASCKYADLDAVFDEQGNVISGYVNHSEVSGATGVKMLGPYAYTAPSYWYLDKRAGGAYGFNTETGPGAQVPPIESIKKMISDDNLWPMNDVWDYHSGRNEFATLNRYLKAFNARYGEAVSAEDFAFRSQISNYETIRAMFEAFAVNKPSATGVIQWMLNSAWPEMFWQLYDWYLMPNGAFYGTKAACQPVNAIYNYGDKNIYLSNDLLDDRTGLTVEALVYDINSNIAFSKQVEASINANQSVKVIDLPDMSKISRTYFLKLKVLQNGEQISSNFYWLSNKPDEHDWENMGWVCTPYKSYADFTQLNNMPKVKVDASYTVVKQENGDALVECALSNNSDKIAFFIELTLKDKTSGETILPVFWDENYISLLPSEQRVVKAKLQAKYIKGKEIEFSYTGINLE